MRNLADEINQYLSYCKIQKGLSRYTIKAYCIDLTQFFNYKTEINFDRANLTDYILHLHSLYKPKTVRRKIASLKAFSHYLYRQDKIDVNPFDKIDTNFKEPLILPRTIPKHLINSIIQASYKNIDISATFKEKSCAIRNAAVIEILFATGARVSEICSLKQDDVDLVAHTVKIFGKGAKERIVQIENKDVLSILKRYVQAYSNKLQLNQYFFLNNRCTRLSEQSVRTIIRNLEKQIQSEIHVTPHMFRHSVATMLLEEDVDIRYIQRILGHSSITTTQIYTHVTSSKQKEILRTKHPRNKMHID